MILTCPACDTKYVVKDDAIPPQGRQVRCASCKHSWHQDPELILAEPASDAEIDFGGPPQPGAEAVEAPLAEVPAEAEAVETIAAEPQPEVADVEQSPWGTVSSEPVESSMPLAGPADEVAMEEAPAVADEWREPVAAGTAPPAEEEFVGYSPIVEDQEPRRRWSVILGVIILIVAAATAFWFIAPAEWKARAGIAQTGATPLQILITTRERQPTNSGQELVLLGGRIINPTDQEQRVPPIRVKLRDAQSKAVLHQWTIRPPRDVLGPGESASFNSAEVDQPRTGDQQVDIALGGQL
jgi:predicted Zn finger-like uncharacterized protein